MCIKVKPNPIFQINMQQQQAYVTHESFLKPHRIHYIITRPKQKQRDQQTLGLIFLSTCHAFFLTFSLLQPPESKSESKIDQQKKNSCGLTILFYSHYFYKHFFLTTIYTFFSLLSSSYFLSSLSQYSLTCESPLFYYISSPNEKNIYRKMKFARSFLHKI